MASLYHDLSDLWARLCYPCPEPVTISVVETCALLSGCGISIEKEIEFRVHISNNDVLAGFEEFGRIENIKVTCAFRARDELF